MSMPKRGHAKFFTKILVSLEYHLITWAEFLAFNQTSAKIYKLAHIFKPTN
jgi:hypothetical protein